MPMSHLVPSARPGMGVALALAVLTIMFFQLPFYKSEAGPLFLLAKIWPVLLAPLVLYGILAISLPDRALYLVFSIYALVLTPFLSMLYLPNGLIDALASTVKTGPITYYFSAAAALALLRPSEKMLERCLLVLGALTFALMLMLWVTVPVELYQPGIAGQKMFSWESERGNFIRMPMMLGMLCLFWLAHCFAAKGRWTHGLLLLGGFVCLILIYKARLPTGVAILLGAMVIGWSLPLRLRWALGALAMVPLALVAMIQGPRLPSLLAEIFDESLFIRLRSVTAAWNWLADDPLKLLFGTGSTSTFSDYGLNDHLNYQDFWLTDIGWLGVLLEYGIIGTALIVLFHARALQLAWRVQGKDPFRRALVTYVVFEIICSTVYSVMLAPGPVVTIAAIAWWLGLRDRMGMTRDQPGLTPPVANPPSTAALPGWALGRVPRGGTD